MLCQKTTQFWTPPRETTVQLVSRLHTLLLTCLRINVSHAHLVDGKWNTSTCEVRYLASLVKKAGPRQASTRCIVICALHARA